jgi:fructan beta-fructosidase
MHWRHAISKYLVHWQNFPIALYPDSIGDIFSGSIVVDNDNTTGFQQVNEKALVPIFTYRNMVSKKPPKTIFKQRELLIVPVKEGHG